LPGLPGVAADESVAAVAREARGQRPRAKSHSARSWHSRSSAHSRA
jgi:hypothetical protein